MMSKSIFTTILVFGITCMFGSITFALDPPVPYDDFNTKNINGCKNCIDTTKWTGSERGDSVGEVERRIKGKKMSFKVKSWGGGDSDSQRQNGRNRIIFKDMPETITGVCFTPAIKKFKNMDCANNLDQSSQVRIRYMGKLYDSNAQDTTENGHVMAAIEIKHAINEDDSGYLKKSEVSVQGGAWRCSNADCSTDDWGNWNTGATDVDLHFGKVKKTNKKPICVGYDSAAKEIVYSFDGDIRTVSEATNGLPAKVADIHPDRVWHVIEARVDAENCQAGRIYGDLDGTVNNVMVYREP